MNMIDCGQINVRKHRGINYSDNYITLDIYFKFDSMDKMRIKFSDPQDYLGKSGKGFVTSLGLKAKLKTNK